MFKKYAKDNGVEIIRGKVTSNHVHIYVSVPPYQSISKLVQYLKGKSSARISRIKEEVLGETSVGCRIFCENYW